MKEIKLKMTKQLLGHVKKPIRDKNNLIIILLETMQQLIVGYEPIGEQKEGFVLRIDKMSRIVYILENKMFSYNFPFGIYEKDNEIIIKESNSGILVNNEHISFLKRICQFGFINSSRVSSFEEDISELMDELADSYKIDEIWCLLKVLQLFEPGYIRYDYDPMNENGKMHPLYHLDIYYADNNTFKLGMEDQVSDKTFLEILDIQEECYYINKKDL